MYALKDDKLSQWSAVRQLYFTALAFTLVFSAFQNETADSLQVERPATSRAALMELDDEGLLCVQ